MFVRYAQVKAFRGVTGLRMLESEPLNEGDPIVFRVPAALVETSCTQLPVVGKSSPSCARHSCQLCSI